MPTAMISNTRQNTAWSVSLLAVMNFFLFADQNLLAPNLSQIAREFGMSELMRDVLLGGNIAFAFWVLGGLVTLGIGYLTDLVPRRQLFVALILVGEIPCLLTGFAQSYSELFWLRALTGIGIGGALPLTYSLIGDYYPHHARAAASGWMALAQGLGIAAGQLLAGFVGPELGWRLPFIIVAIPNFLLVIPFWISVREPERGGAEAGLRTLIESGRGYASRIDWRSYRQLFGLRTNRLAFLQGIPGAVPWGVFFVFLNDFYSQDKGYSIELATLIVMTVGAAAIVGGFFGGILGSKLYARSPRLLPLLCAISTIAGVIPMAILLNYPAQQGMRNPSLAVPLAAGVITGLTVAITGPNVKAMLLNVNAPETRGSIFSLYNLTDDLGKGFGPVLISALIALFGRAWAFNIANLLWLVCGVVLFAIVPSFPKDEERLLALLAERARAG